MEEEDSTRVVVRQLQAGHPFHLDFDLVIGWSGGSRRERVSLTGRETIMEVAAPDRVESVTIDPGVTLYLQAVEERAASEPPGPDRASKAASGGSPAGPRVPEGHPGG